jgi:pimeloyl-ACP methyl ester carboxylesterase
LLCLLPLFIVAGFFVFASIAKADDININQDTTWHDGEIIIINDEGGDLVISPGAELTIEAGVIVKMADFSKIKVYGDLEIQGSSTKPVIITSIKDDSAGGDTNNDGNATIPAPGSWGKIKTFGSLAQINIDYAQIKYGGAQEIYPCFADSPFKIASTGNTIVITHSQLVDNNSLFEIGDSNLKINYSNIYNNYNPAYCYEQNSGMDCGAAIGNYGNTIYDLTNNYWGHPLGPTQIITDDDWNKTLLGTHIFGQADYVPFLTSPWTPAPPKQKLNPVILIPGLLGSWDMGSGYELDPIFNTYDNLWAALKQYGYEENKTLFALPYDWRRSNIYTALLLKDKIQEVISACNSANPIDFDCNKVDLVAHSMGGLVARAYIESNDYNNNVDQLIFLSTPQRGAPMAYLAWEGGDAAVKSNMFKKALEKILDLGALKNGYFTRFSYIRKLPIQSLQELLPVYDYLKDADTGNFKTYPDEYPANDFLNNLNNPIELKKLDNIKLTNILGDSEKSNTLNYIRVNKNSSQGEKWEYGKPQNYGNKKTDQGLEYDNGDDTVPEISNQNFYNSTEKYIASTSHMQIVTDAQSDVIEELTGKRPEKEIRENIFTKFVMIRIFSPADFVIIAPDGKKLGKDFANNQNINEINGAFYSGVSTDGEFAVIPDPLDGEYKVELQGTGNGEYKLSVSGIDDATSTDKDFTGQITTGAIQNFNINYSSSSPDLLADLQPQDTTPPNLTINSPLEGSSYKHSDKMIVKYDASDDFSGIASVEMRIDNKLISSTTINLFDYQLGAHTLLMIARDQVGNSTEKKVNFKIITDIKSAIADIETTYKNGWLKNLCRKNILIGELKILAGTLNFIDKEKSRINKMIEETKNNPKLNAKTKEKFIDTWNKELVELDKNRQKTIKIDLTIFEKTLNENKKFNKKFNYLNQTGYAIIKDDLKYLKNNL